MLYLCKMSIDKIIVLCYNVLVRLRKTKQKNTLQPNKFFSIKYYNIEKTKSQVQIY